MQWVFLHWLQKGIESMIYKHNETVKVWLKLKYFIFKQTSPEVSRGYMLLFSFLLCDAISQVQAARYKYLLPARAVPQHEKQYCSLLWFYSSIFPSGEKEKYR